jgi:uncharacterized phage-associated protein
LQSAAGFSGFMFNKNLFIDQEKETITNIGQKYSDISSWDIVDLSHEEKAWKESEGNRE